MALVRSIFAAILAICSTVAAAQPTATSFVSGGVDIPAFLQRAGDGEPRAVVINLHGNPGGRIRAESALATNLAKQGVDTFWFNYRGLWGNQGSYSLTNAIGDARAAIDFLKSANAKKKFSLGDAPIILAGYSFGSAAALLGAAADDRVAGVVAFAPCDHGYFGQELAKPQSRIKRFLDDVVEDILDPRAPCPEAGQRLSLTSSQANRVMASRETRLRSKRRRCCSWQDGTTSFARLKTISFRCTGRCATHSTRDLMPISSTPGTDLTGPPRPRATK